MACAYYMGIQLKMAVGLYEEPGLNENMREGEMGNTYFSVRAPSFEEFISSRFILDSQWNGCLLDASNLEAAGTVSKLEEALLSSTTGDERLREKHLCEDGIRWL